MSNYSRTDDENDSYSECDGNQCSDIWDAYLIKFNETGEVEWENTFSSLDLFNENYDWAGEAIDLTDDGGAIIRIDNGRFGFLRIDNVQNILNNHNKSEKLTKFILNDNYPNPFKSSTRISYVLTEKASVKIDIYNVYGINIESLLINDQFSGLNSIAWEAKDKYDKNIPSEMYFYIIKAGDNKLTKKMLLLK